eukprot:5641276-Alexandrium_andersonii.AAC.1
MEKELFGPSGRGMQAVLVQKILRSRLDVDGRGGRAKPASTSRCSLEKTDADASKSNEQRPLGEL